MKYIIEPYGDGFRLICNGWCLGGSPFILFKTYEGACEVINAIDKHAINPSGVSVTDYSACLERSA